MQVVVWLYQAGVSPVSQWMWLPGAPPQAQRGHPGHPAAGCSQGLSACDQAGDIACTWLHKRTGTPCDPTQNS